MSFNQISPCGSIVSAVNPTNFTGRYLKSIIFDALNLDDYTFSWTQQKSQPYRDNPSEKRIQIQAAVNDVGINRPISPTEKSIILGVYNAPAGYPLLVAWDTSVNRKHGQKSCYVQIEDIAQAITRGIYSTKDKNDAPIYTMTPSFLGDYISLLKESNILNLNPKITTSSLNTTVKKNNLSKRKKRALRKISQIEESMSKLTATERKSIYKQRIGQGLFKELLLDKYHCKCALCDITTKDMLIASHIKPWSESNDSEKLDVNNGLLLCAHHDTLFDKNLISFDDTGDIMISSTLTPAEQDALNLRIIPLLAVDNEMKPYLSNHRTKLKS